jgi:hypothetical protein
MTSTGDATGVINYAPHPDETHFSTTSMPKLSPATQGVLQRAMEFSGPEFERLVRQMLGEAIRSAVAHTQQHRGNEVWTCDADELLAIADQLEAQ